MKNFSKKIWLQALTILNLDNVSSLYDLKNTYRLLCSKHHPDRGVDTEKMQQVNWAYSYVLEHIDEKDNSDNVFNAKVSNLSEEGQKIFEQLLNFEGLEILIVGSWLWIKGDTKKYKENLKDLGLYWHFKKQMWVYAGTKTTSRGNVDFDKIVDVYGVSRHQKTQSVKLSSHN